MTKIIGFVFIIFSFISCSSQGEKHNKLVVQISSGDMDRQNSVVTVESPYLLSEKNYHLTGPDDQTIPVQISNQTLIFILPELSAEEEVAFEFLPAEERLESQTSRINFKEDAVELSTSSGGPVFQYRTGVGGLDPGITDEVFYRGGYLHPVYTPNGRAITEHYTENRPHQNGIWTGWYKTEWNGLKPDFWSQAERTGKVEAVSVNRIETGPVFGELQTIHHFNEKITENSSTILSDEWTVRSYNILNESGRPVNMIDLDVVQTNISDHTFRLIEHVYGGVGFRGSDQWIGEENMQLITSEGENREEAHTSRARWVLMSGEINGKMTSIAILAHPDNLRFPEPVFINQREPFFTFAPLQAGDITLESGEIFRAKYRYVTLDGEIPSTDYIEELWQDYANPVEASIIKKTE